MRRTPSDETPIEVARKHRDQLIAGTVLLEELPLDSDDDRYRRLQEQLNQAAPDLSTAPEILTSPDATAPLSAPDESEETDPEDAEK